MSPGSERIGAPKNLVPSITTSLGGPLFEQPLPMLEAVELELEELAALLHSDESKEEGELPSDISSAISSGTVFNGTVGVCKTG